VWPEIFSFEIFGKTLPLRSFGFFVALGFLVGVHVAGRLSKRYGSDPEHDLERIPDISWSVLIGVIVGARLAYVLVNLGYFSSHPLEIFKIWEGGLVMYGGLILALLLGVRMARKLGMQIWQTADYCLTGAFLGQAVARIGCIAVGDDYGRTVPLAEDGSAPWWTISFTDPLLVGSAFPIELATIPVHPSQIYMSIKALSLFFLGLWLLKRKRFHGQVLCTLMAGYALLRGFIEFFRGDAEARGGIFKDGLSPADVNLRLADLGIADASGRIRDIASYRELLRQGTEGIQPELLVSTSQMVAIVTFVLALILYKRLQGKPENAV
jgi:phosphatidylglycerol---prolipoprotein diacylglyceryl transferase